MSMGNLYILLGSAFLSLFIGIYFLLHYRKNEVEHFHTTNLICWLLIALFPVLLIFSVFPTSNITGSIKGFSVGGAIAAFIFIWRYGTKSSLLADKLDKLTKENQELERKIQELERLHKHEIFNYEFKKLSGKRIALVTGRLEDFKLADIWVNSENTNMEMARPEEDSVSGTIRYLGAKRDGSGKVTEDSIDNELKNVMGVNNRVQPATVLVTKPGELSTTHNVKKIFHVAAVQGEFGNGYRPIRSIERCITNSLTKADSPELQRLGLKSIVFPLFGTGTARGDKDDIPNRLIQAAISYIESKTDSSIDHIFFLATRDGTLKTCKDILEKTKKFKPVKD